MTGFFATVSMFLVLLANISLFVHVTKVTCFASGVFGVDVLSGLFLLAETAELLSLGLEIIHTLVHIFANFNLSFFSLLALTNQLEEHNLTYS